MNYGAMSGQRTYAPPNPAAGAPSSDPFNFVPTAGGTGGAGSNQYQQLPPWMNNSPGSGGSGISSGGWQGSMVQSPNSGGSMAAAMSFMPRPSGGPSQPNVPGGGMDGYRPYQPGGGPTSPIFGLHATPGSTPGGGGLGVPSGSGGLPGGWTNPFTTLGWMGKNGGPIMGNANFSIQQPSDPKIQGNLFNYLNANVGQGVTPFNLPVQLPFGGETQPGQLNAPANPLLQQMMSYFSGGSTSMPGGNTLSTIANQGISALPEWQAAVNAMGQNISQNEAGLAEQLGSSGNLRGSGYGNAMSNYMQGVTSQQNALLGQLQQQNILQGQIPVAEGLLGGAQQFGQYAQGLGQQNIQNVLNEYIRQSPQYNPLLGLEYGAATTFNPALPNPPKGGGILGAIGQSAPDIISALVAGGLI